MFVYDIFDSKEDVVIGGLAVDIGTTTVSAVLINMETGEILRRVLPVTDRSVMEPTLSTVLSRRPNRAARRSCRTR